MNDPTQHATATATAKAAASRPEQRSPNPVAAILGLTLAAVLMVLAFAAPAVSSGAHNLPLGVAGPGGPVSQVQSGLEARSPGTFEVHTYATATELITAVEQRDLIGGLAVTTDGLQVITAGGAGTPYAALLKTLGAQLGTTTGTAVTYADVAPLTADDPAGAGMTALALPLVFVGIASAILFIVVVRVRMRTRVAAVLSIAVLAGLGTTAVLQYGFGSFDGSYLLTSAGVAAGIAAISLTVLGLESLLGYAGLALAAVVLMFVANPLSGIAAGPAWLPQPWGQVGQFLPVGAAGTVVRSAAFFDGRGATQAWLVLAGWAAFGLVLAGVASAVQGGRNRREYADRLGQENASVAG